MDICEILSSHDGRGSFPRLWDDHRFRRRGIVLEADPRFLSAIHCYRPIDLLLGESVTIMNRDMFLYDCDEFMRKWYKQNMGHTDDQNCLLFMS
jgi:hypothetical protein